MRHRTVLLLLTWLQVPVTAAEPPTRIEAPVAAARIVVHKAQRQLVLYSDQQVLRRFAIGLGFQPTGSKRRQGDGATPEGEYLVVVKNPQSQFYLSLGINYPNRADADRGLDAGQISAAEHRRIVEAAEKGVRPPWNTALGGEIFIHGRGAGSDWTWGCVALDDADMKELFAAVKIGTKVVIRP